MQYKQVASLLHRGHGDSRSAQCSGLSIRPALPRLLRLRQRLLPAGTQPCAGELPMSPGCANAMLMPPPLEWAVAGAGGFSNYFFFPTTPSRSQPLKIDTPTTGPQLFPAWGASART